MSVVSLLCALMLSVVSLLRRALATLTCAWMHLSFAWRTRYSCLLFGCLDSKYPAHTEDTSIYGPSV